MHFTLQHRCIHFSLSSKNPPDGQVPKTFCARSSRTASSRLGGFPSAVRVSHPSSDLRCACYDGEAHGNFHRGTYENCRPASAPFRYRYTLLHSISARIDCTYTCLQAQLICLFDGSLFNENVNNDGLEIQACLLAKEFYFQFFTQRHYTFHRRANLNKFLMETNRLSVEFIRV